MIKLAYIYIGLPLLIFILGWLKLPIAMPLAALFSYSIYGILKVQTINNKVFIEPKVLLSFLLLIIIYLLFSGIGSYSFQNEDHHYRNALFQDLVNFKWPVLYQIKGFNGDNPLEGQQTFLAYYAGYWLPAALFGKVFGLAAGQFVLYIWSVLGLCLILFFLCNYFKKYSIRMFWYFVAWGSLYFIGSFIFLPAKEVFKGNAYLWAGNLLFADGTTGLIYWTFNQTIVPWLIILLIMREVNTKNLFFQTSLIFFFGPFSFVGFLPFVAYFMAQKANFSLANFEVKKLIFNYLSFQNIVGSAVVLGLSYLYFSANSSGNVFQIVIPDWQNYWLFMIISVGLIFILIAKRYLKEPLYYIILVILLLLPFFQLGFGLDFTARASIPAMFILLLLVIEFLENEPNYFMKKVILVYLIIAGIGHNIQFGRSVYFTGLQALSTTDLGSWLVNSNSKIVKNIGERIEINKGNNITIKNNLGTLNNPNNILVRNFMGLTSQSVFYKYLAKTNEKN